jgi:ribosomal protein L6P/L9E
VQIGEQLVVEGPKGKHTVPVPKGVEVQQADGILVLVRQDDK